MCFDHVPPQPRPPIQVAGDLVRRSDRLSNEGARTIKRLVEDREALSAELERLARMYDDDGPLASEWGHTTIAKHLRDVAAKLR